MKLSGDSKSERKPLPWITERGALNYVTSETVKRATKLVRKGEVIPLNLPLDSPAHGSAARPPLRRTVRLHNRIRSIGEGRFSVANDDDIEIALQGSSHIDALSHFGVIEPGSDSVFYGGKTLDEVYPEATAKTIGIDSYGGAIVTRGILLDAVGVVGGEESEYLPDGFAVNDDVVKECLRRARLELRTGDAVLIFTGYEARIRKDIPLELTAGLDGSTLPIWREKQISVLAADNLGVERIPGDYSIHIGALRDSGIVLGELWALKGLVAACRGDDTHEFLLVSVPLNLPGAFGSPANAVAIR